MKPRILTKVPPAISQDCVLEIYFCPLCPLWPLIFIFQKNVLGGERGSTEKVVATKGHRVLKEVCVSEITPDFGKALTLAFPLLYTRMQ